MSEEGQKSPPKSGNRNNNNRRRNNNRKRKPSGNKSSATQTDGQNASRPVHANSPNNRNKRPNNKNRRPKSLTPGRVLQKYENLQEQYLTARRKYFELFARVTGKQLEKVVRNKETSLRNLRNYEGTLEKDWQKELVRKKNNPYKEDRQFSTTHDLEPKGDLVSFVGDFEDPHLLPIQKESDWSADTEESEGTSEDYEAYKESMR